MRHSNPSHNRNPLIPGSCLKLLLALALARSGLTWWAYQKLIVIIMFSVFCMQVLVLPVLCNHIYWSHFVLENHCCNWTNSWCHNCHWCFDFSGSCSSVEASHPSIYTTMSCVFAFVVHFAFLNSLHKRFKQSYTSPLLNSASPKHYLSTMNGMRNKRQTFEMYFVLWWFKDEAEVGLPSAKIKREEELLFITLSNQKLLFLCIMTGSVFWSTKYSTCLS